MVWARGHVAFLSPSGFLEVIVNFLLLTICVPPGYFQSTTSAPPVCDPFDAYDCIYLGYLFSFKFKNIMILLVSYLSSFAWPTRFD